ncbi:MAG: tRNA (adenosine(37)-N6)-threonylcarbamoyltransferase complex ATPase subunit type 1 TsaE [Atopobiaceae bacterium]|nr:tRNA (adenosine(37)-N6)-threonylcarbamoyltransferase complex ATPase subunit type 1 TsaE [Atopobiaceae bacterium]
MSRSKPITTTSQEQTIALGQVLGSHVQAGDIIVLSGDLGAGKTQFTKGVARALGISSDITSPTFNILMVYDNGRIPLYHFDLYRLENPDELEDTGIFDVLGAEGVCVIEWGERFADELGDERLDLVFRRRDSEVLSANQTDCGKEPVRELVFYAHGERSEHLLETLFVSLDELACNPQ